MKSPGKDSKYATILLLSLVSFLFSWLVFFQHKGSASLNGICSAIGGLGQCDLVAASSYARLFGVDNSIIGIIGFGAMAFMSGYICFFRKNQLYAQLIMLGSLIAGVLAAIFIYLQVFVIHAYCIYCLVVDVASLALLWIAIQWMKLRKGKAQKSQDAAPEE